MGGSNGGLLVGAVMAQRPDLFGAVVCQVPLLDMIRFSKIGAGASWVGEYGDPENPVEREAILKYSPYQNVKRGVTYPPVFFITATSDDRVTPVHARKMAARMEEQGHDVLFYENTDGGHAAAANHSQQAEMNALTTSIWRRSWGLVRPPDRARLPCDSELMVRLTRFPCTLRVGWPLAVRTSMSGSAWLVESHRSPDRNLDLLQLEVELHL